MATPCDRCGKNEATIHLTQIQHTEMTTRHLCEPCAAALGLDSGGPAAAAPLADFLAQMGKAIAGESAASAGTCPSCGLTLADFKRTGRLGCARCWSTFEGSLRGLLRKLHGGTQHVGRVYLSADPTETDRVQRVTALRRSLQRAVDEEDFERAAALRDQIRRLETQGV
ncbi:MAG TPA: UvrB/UvrC motif-containing protein [Longimicrobiaceae bacterium]|nr:UvrB/UvrC motif-containing protein [Longimicrobiaceae bacterium]